MTEMIQNAVNELKALEYHMSASLPSIQEIQGLSEVFPMDFSKVHFYDLLQRHHANE